MTRAWAAACLRGGGAEGGGGREGGRASRMGCMNAKMADAAAEVHAPPVVRLRACVRACLRDACMHAWVGGRWEVAFGLRFIASRHLPVPCGKPQAGNGKKFKRNLLVGVLGYLQVLHLVCRVPVLCARAPSHWAVPHGRIVADVRLGARMRHRRARAS